MSQVYLITGASTGFGALTARAVASKEHIVYAGMYMHDHNIKWRIGIAIVRWSNGSEHNNGSSRFMGTLPDYSV